MSERRRGRTLSPEEEHLWQTVAATVKPRRTRKRPVAPAAAAEPPTPAPPAKPQARPPRKGVTVKPIGRPEPAVTMLNAAPPNRKSGLDGKREDRFRKGELEIEARIDLHGLTLDLAHTALGGFLIQCRTRGVRTVLVITGKGFPTGEGVLRRSVPRWLSEPPFGAMIASMAPAQPRHGGEGALYVYLRRKRA